MFRFELNWLKLHSLFYYFICFLLFSRYNLVFKVKSIFNILFFNLLRVLIYFILKRNLIEKAFLLKNIHFFFAFRLNILILLLIWLQIILLHFQFAICIYDFSLFLVILWLLKIFNFNLLFLQVFAFNYFFVCVKFFCLHLTLV